MNPIKVGVIGIGEVGSGHARLFKTFPGKAELVAVCDLDEARVRPMAKEWGAVYYAKIEEFLATDIDAVSIASPQKYHRDAAVAAAQAGKHILLEKPMAMTVEESDQIIKACAKADVKLMLGFTHRFHSELRRAKELIDGGRLGRISMGVDSMCFSGHGWKMWNWRKELSGGGPMIRDGVHAVDRLRWLIGSEIKEVYAKQGNYAHPQADVEDNAIAILEFENGAIASMMQNWSEFKSPTHCDLYIYGTDGLIRIKTWHSLQFNTFGEGWIQTRMPGENNLRDEQEAFLDAIIEDRTPPITGEDGKIALAVILAIYASAESGKPSVPGTGPVSMKDML
jgi:predicted dehydrogenase